jgi:hypothetical protein
MTRITPCLNFPLILCALAERVNRSGRNNGPSANENLTDIPYIELPPPEIG